MEDGLRHGLFMVLDAIGAPLLSHAQRRYPDLKDRSTAKVAGTVSRGLTTRAICFGHWLDPLSFDTNGLKHFFTCFAHADFFGAALDRRPVLLTKVTE